MYNLTFKNVNYFYKVLCAIRLISSPGAKIFKINRFWSYFSPQCRDFDFVLQRKLNKFRRMTSPKKKPE